MQNAFLLLIGIVIGTIISLLIFKSLFKKDEIEKKLKHEIEDEMKIQFKEDLNFELNKALKEQILQKDKMEEEMKFKLTKSVEDEINKALKIKLNENINIEELRQNVKSLEESIKEFKSKEVGLNLSDKKNNEDDNRESKVMNFTGYKTNGTSKENTINKSDNSAWIKEKIVSSKIEHLVMLVIRKGSNFGSKIQLQRNINTTIGRADNNMVVISENKVSSTHAIIKSNENEHFIQDLKSSTGTYVNDNLINGAKLLRNGDVIRIGDTEFIFCKII